MEFAPDTENEDNGGHSDDKNESNIYFKSQKCNLDGVVRDETSDNSTDTRV